MNRFGGQCSVFLISDTYIGLDQRVNVHIPAPEPSPIGPAPGSAELENPERLDGRDEAALEDQPALDNQGDDGDEDEGFWD